MITEDYCTYEISKLLEEKGFNEYCFALYDSNKILIQSGIRLNNIQVGRVEGSYSAPTLQMTMKWLRKKHELHISVAPYLNEEGEVTWVWEIIKIETATIIADSLDDDDFDSCEEAVDAALKYCLTKLI